MDPFDFYLFFKKFANMQKIFLYLKSQYLILENLIRLSKTYYKPIRYKYCIKFMANQIERNILGPKVLHI